MFPHSDEVIKWKIKVQKPKIYGNVKFTSLFMLGANSEWPLNVLSSGNIVR